MKNRLQLSLYAASSARRAVLHDMIARSLPRSEIKVMIRLDSSRRLSDILIADLATHAEDSAFLELLERAPDKCRSIALIDSPEPRWEKPRWRPGRTLSFRARRPPKSLTWL